MPVAAEPPKMKHLGANLTKHAQLSAENHEARMLGIPKDLKKMETRPTLTNGKTPQG